MPTNAYNTPFTAQSELALLAEKDVLPRNINLKAFDPHRDAAQFSCRAQAERAPKLTPEAQALHEEAMQLSSPALWPNERNWPRSVLLWQQAAARGHWKAALMWLQIARTGQGVNSAKGQFHVSAQDPETVLSGIEALMRQGVADAFYWMGVFWGEGYGLPKTDHDRAWAFWELAADLGSPLAQTEIAKALPFVDRKQEKRDVAEWANPPLKVTLLECAYAQGHGEGSYLLGQDLNIDADSSRRLPRFKTPAEQYAYALQVLHDGVKFGSENAANYLFASFDDGEALVNHAIDKFRARRYKHLADALYNNPDLRFPNLDRVVPLPPAKLPTWDGEVESLINAAKSVRAAPAAGKASSAQGRALVPDGHALVAPKHSEPPMHATEFTPQGTVLARAPQAGYYQPLHRSAVDAPADTSHLPERLRHPIEHTTQRLQREALQDAPPLAFAAGEVLSLARSGVVSLVANFADTAEDHALVYWRLVGIAQAAQPVSDHLAKAGLVHAIGQATDTLCADGAACPQSGIWQPEVTNPEHPLAKVFNASLSGESWRRQAFVQEGRSLPKFAQQLAPVLGKDEAAQLKVQWRLMVACEPGFEAQGAPASAA